MVSGLDEVRSQQDNRVLSAGDVHNREIDFSMSSENQRVILSSETEKNRMPMTKVPNDK